MSQEKIDILDKCMQVIKEKSDNEATINMIKIVENKNLDESTKLKKLSHEQWKSRVKKIK